MEELELVENEQKLFEDIKHTTEDGVEYWLARELAPLLGYSTWQKFTTVIKRAITSCDSFGQNPDDHFNQVVKMVSLGSGAERKVNDFELSRYACYLIVQNGDPSKPVIAAGQAYFAIQTRKQELQDETGFMEMSEDDKRLALRGEMKAHNRALSAAAQDAGVRTNSEFAAFQDQGYMGLYNGMRAHDIHKKKGLKKSQKILDHMGSTELAANLFRATQTEEKLRREQISSREEANRTHFNVGRTVRKTIEELGGTMPEDLPTPNQSIQQIERKKKNEIK